MAGWREEPQSFNAHVQPFLRPVDFVDHVQESGLYFPGMLRIPWQRGSRIACEQQVFPGLPGSTSAPGQLARRLVRGRQRKGVAIQLALWQTHSF